MFRIDQESQNKVYEMFGRNEKTANQDVEIIKTWMQSQPHLPELIEDVKIRNFLNINKYSIEKTKKKIDNYYTLRGLIPDLFTKCNPKLENIQKMFDLMHVSTHPKAVDGIHKIWFARPKAPNTLRFEGLSKIMFSIFEVRLYEDLMFDDIFVIDLANLAINDLKQYTSPIVPKTITAYEKIYSLRIRAIHYLNCPSFMSTLLSILKTIFKPKIFERIHTHQNSDVLTEILSKDEIPKDYGGDGPSLDELNEMTKRKLLEYQERFDVLDNLRVDESLRPEKLDNDNILGYYGNFKKIDVD